MSASLEDIKRWLKSSEGKEASHLIIALDTYYYENYPVYVFPDEDVHKEIKRIQGASMQKIDEIYNMSIDINQQLSEATVWNV